MRVCQLAAASSFEVADLAGAAGEADFGGAGEVPAAGGQQRVVAAVELLADAQAEVGVVGVAEVRRVDAIGGDVDPRPAEIGGERGALGEQAGVVGGDAGLQFLVAVVVAGEGVEAAAELGAGVVEPRVDQLDFAEQAAGVDFAAGGEVEQAAAEVAVVVAPAEDRAVVVAEAAVEGDAAGLAFLDGQGGVEELAARGGFHLDAGEGAGGEQALDAAFDLGCVVVFPFDSFS